MDELVITYLLIKISIILIYSFFLLHNTVEIILININNYLFIYLVYLISMINDYIKMISKSII